MKNTPRTLIALIKMVANVALQPPVGGGFRLDGSHFYVLVKSLKLAFL